MSVFVSVCMCAYVHVHVRVCVHVCMCVSVSSHVCIRSPPDTELKPIIINHDFALVISARTHARTHARTSTHARARTQAHAHARSTQAGRHARRHARTDAGTQARRHAHAHLAHHARARCALTRAVGSRLAPQLSTRPHSCRRAHTRMHTRWPDFLRARTRLSSVLVCACAQWHIRALPVPDPRVCHLSQRLLMRSHPSAALRDSAHGRSMKGVSMKRSMKGRHRP